jgi:hypothetical protein
MHDESKTPFDSVDGAHEYVALLCATIVEARHDLEEDVAQASREQAARRLDALRLVDYKLDRLQHHLEASRCLLNDLRTLRRLLLGERLSNPRRQPEADERPPFSI